MYNTVTGPWILQDLRNNFQFSQVAHVALAVTKFKKMAEIRKVSGGVQCPAGDSASVEPTQEQTDKANALTPTESLGSLITKDKLDNLELKFKLRQLQLEVSCCKLLSPY